MLDDGVREQILTKLTANLNIDKVILFGSFAHGTPGKNSDVDLIVVTDDDYMPKNYEDNMRNYLKVSSALRDLKRKIP
ncbi:MAG: nucleotidyltransferase domain-containing protein, partial [Desulfobacterales bacterium]|nr:nucleotidyltransferase domain-containing protein [Desulfobacterales bacterium]